MQKFKKLFKALFLGIGFFVFATYFWVAIAFLFYLGSTEPYKGEILNSFTKFIVTDIGIGIFLFSLLPLLFFLKIVRENEKKFQKNLTQIP